MLVGIQSPIPLIYLLHAAVKCSTGWDSVTYPLDILDRLPGRLKAKVGIQSPIPLIYLPTPVAWFSACWDSVTYPLDILDTAYLAADRWLGFSHLSP